MIRLKGWSMCDLIASLLSQVSTPSSPTDLIKAECGICLRLGGAQPTQGVHIFLSFTRSGGRKTVDLKATKSTPDILIKIVFRKILPLENSVLAQTAQQFICTVILSNTNMGPQKKLTGLQPAETNLDPVLSADFCQIFKAKAAPELCWSLLP